MYKYQFPHKKIFCDNKPFSSELLHSLLDEVYTVSPPFTGYLKIGGDNSSLLFLFFLKGTPYSAGKYADNKPISYSIQELGAYLASSIEKNVHVSLCETDPVLLKDMLLFLQEVPDIKAPATLIDLEYIVRHIRETCAEAMIALERDKKINFFFFRDGKGAIAHYSDMAFERPVDMTVDEEMLLYAFQPGDKVQAFIFSDMVIIKEDESNQLDRESLYKLLTGENPKNSFSGDAETPSLPAMNGCKPPVNALHQEPKAQNFILSIESGPLQGKRFTVKLPCTIGRRDCDLILDDRLISRRHAEIKMVSDQLVIEDLASTNGTRVNGTAVTRKELSPNDLISIGHTDLRIMLA
jgi:hypothetical protein